MARKSVLQLSTIMEYFCENKIIKKAENSLASGHVLEMKYHAEIFLLTGQVQASMRNRKYKVEIELDEEHSIIRSVCDCPRGLGLCHHMAALALHAHYNVSITDESCSWAPPKGAQQTTPLTAEKCFGEAKEFSALNEQIGEENLEKLKNDLEECHPTHLYWLLTGEPNKEEESIIDIEQLIFSRDFLDAPDQKLFIQNSLRVDEEIQQKVAKITIGQSNNPQWLIAHKHRITSSNFGLILKCCGRNRFPPSLFKTLTGAYDLSGVKQIQWGRTHEIDGITALENMCNLKVETTGFWLHESGILGASPDGLVGQDSTVEVKCPYTYRESILKECLKEDSSYILQYDSQMDTFIVNKNHNYYHQIQGTLHITQRKMCYLVIWITKDVLVIKVERDDDWRENLDILQNFYYLQYIKFVTNV